MTKIRLPVLAGANGPALRHRCRSGAEVADPTNGAATPPVARSM